MRLLQEAGENGPFVCAGHSAGAGVCIQFAMAAPPSMVITITIIITVILYHDYFGVIILIIVQLIVNINYYLCHT